MSKKRAGAKRHQTDVRSGEKCGVSPVAHDKT